MNRRGLFSAALAAAGGVLATKAHSQVTQRVVYHLADPDKAVFVLGNIHNHFEGAGGAGAISIALVVHGPALNSFRATTHDEALRQGFAEAIRTGAKAYACGHTMKAQRLARSDVLPGFAVAEKGGVVLLADLQSQGWAYLRP
jgi:uncharacterized protein